MQLDKIFVVEWGIEGLKSWGWIKLNMDFTKGMFFEVNPTEKEAGSYKVYVDMIDDNKEPQIGRFEFDLYVIDSSQLNFLTKDKDKKDREQQFLIKEQISVAVEPANEDNNFQIRFSREVVLPVDCSQWTNDNLGKERLKVVYLPSEETQTILYDQDLEIVMQWVVTKVYIKRWLSNVTTINDNSDKQGLRHL